MVSCQLPAAWPPARRRPGLCLPIILPVDPREQRPQERHGSRASCEHDAAALTIGVDALEMVKTMELCVAVRKDAQGKAVADAVACAMWLALAVFCSCSTTTDAARPVEAVYGSNCGQQYSPRSNAIRSLEGSEPASKSSGKATLNPKPRAASWTAAANTDG